MKLWSGRLPGDDPAELVRKLYAAENCGKAEPSGSQDMIGLIYPGVNRLDFDFAVRGGRLPRPHRVEQRSGDRPLARASDPRASRRAAAAGLQSAGREEPRPRVDRPAWADGQGLLRRDHCPRRQGPGPGDERLHGLLGSDPAAHRARTRRSASICPACCDIISRSRSGRCIPAVAAAICMLSPRIPSPARSASPSALPSKVSRN